jgi:hypothetical protein
LVIQCSNRGAATRTYPAASFPNLRIHPTQPIDLTLRPVSLFFGSFFNVLDARCDPNGFTMGKEVVHYWTLAGGVRSRPKPHFWIEDVTLTTASSLTSRIVSADRDYS